MQISTNSLINSVATLCGKDLTEVVNMWVFNGGHPQFIVSFDFNRKRNCIELEVGTKWIDNLHVVNDKQFDKDCKGSKWNFERHGRIFFKWNLRVENLSAWEFSDKKHFYNSFSVVRETFIVSLKHR